MISRRSLGLVGPLFAIAVLSAACGDDGVGPRPITRDDVTRAYSAVTFTTTTDGETTDHLAAGAALDLALHGDGMTTGRLFVPGGDEGGGDLDADLTGSFSFDDATDRIALDQTADTFVRDMTLTAVRSGAVVQLEGERSFGATTVRLVLR